MDTLTVLRQKLISHFFLKLILSLELIDMVTRHNVSKSHSNRSIISLLEYSLSTSYTFKLRRDFDQYFVSSQHLLKI